MPRFARSRSDQVADTAAVSGGYHFSIALMPDGIEAGVAVLADSYWRAQSALS